MDPEPGAPAALDRVLDGQVGIVTGAGQGVGRGVALALAAAGAKVVVLGRTLYKCAAVVAEIEARGGEAIAQQCDIEHGDQVLRSVQDTVERWSRIDVLVNNAQSKVYKSLRKMTEADMETMWQSGPMASLRFMQACFPHLRESQGCVINMGSGSSVLPLGQMGGYAMTKEAVRVLARVAAVEWGRFGIRVNSICPLAMTPGFEEFGQDAPGAIEAQVLPTIPLGRFGDPEADIGRAVVYLASRDGRYVTGTTLMVDGGYNYLR
jgi:NAD(P)-dependent dehydrogenase (short-subunit alcohol dehydrogenase family)